MRLSKKKVSKKLISLLTLILLALWIIGCNNPPQYDADDYFSKATFKDEKEKFLIKTINQTILGNLSTHLSDSTETKYQNAFWAMELIQYKSKFCDSIIRSCFNFLNSRSTDFQISLLEIVFSLYQEEFVKEVNSFANQTDNPKHFACVLLT